MRSVDREAARAVAQGKVCKTCIFGCFMRISGLGFRLGGNDSWDKCMYIPYNDGNDGRFGMDNGWVGAGRCLGLVVAGTRNNDCIHLDVRTKEDAVQHMVMAQAYEQAFQGMDVMYLPLGEERSILVPSTATIACAQPGGSSTRPDLPL